MKKYIFILFLVGCCVSYVKAQQIYDDLTKIRENYYSPKSERTYSVKIYYFDKNKLSSPLDSSFGKYSFFLNKSYINIEGITKISNGKTDVYISDNDKSITILKTDSMPSSFDISLLYFDSLSKSQNILVTNRVNGNMKTAVFAFVHDPLDSVVIKYNKITYLLSAIDIYYNAPLNDDYPFPPVIKMKYFNNSNNNVESPFSFESIFKITNNRVVLQPKYRKYTLRNNLKF